MILYKYNTIQRIMKKITFGTRQLNQLLDDTLMKKYSYPSETLMEIAGIAVAQVADLILRKNEKTSVCVLAGPGNNGGDGLVAARHLKLMKYDVNVILFKKLQGKNGNYVTLCELNDIPVSIAECFGNPEEQNTINNFSNHLEKSGLVIDGIFGFPLTGEIRSPYKYFLPHLTRFQQKILSIDIPSGWDANQGNIHNLFVPQYLISLGMPKKCSQKFEGEHYFGGRFVPEKIKKELDIELPQFEGSSLYTRL